LARSSRSIAGLVPAPASAKPSAAEMSTPFDEREIEHERFVRGHALDERPQRRLDRRRRAKKEMAVPQEHRHDDRGLAARHRPRRVTDVLLETSHAVEH